jgi:hypothetical protein
VEIKCQLDATDVFLLQNLLLAQHVSGTIMPIIRSSRVLYSWLQLVVFGVWFTSCRYGVELRVMCPVCGLLQQLHTRYATCRLSSGLTVKSAYFLIRRGIEDGNHRPTVKHITILINTEGSMYKFP